MFELFADITGLMPETTGLPQTYIIAQNPAVLAKLMMENQKRGINPAAYTTPASVFNTLAVGLDDSNPNVSLKTTKLPAADLLKLDPIAESERLRSQFSANSSASQLANPLLLQLTPMNPSIHTRQECLRVVCLQRAASSFAHPKQRNTCKPKTFLTRLCPRCPDIAYMGAWRGTNHHQQKPCTPKVAAWNATSH